MDLRSFLDDLRDRWRLLAVTTMLGALGAALASMLATPMYTATVSALVVPKGGVDPSSVTAPEGSQWVQDVVQAYAAAARSEVVTAAVIDQLDLTLTPTQLADTIEVTSRPSTQVLQISVTAPDPWLAQQGANSATKHLLDGARGLTGVIGVGDHLISLQVLDPAPLPASPSSPSRWTYLAVGFLLGLALGVGAIVMSKVAARSSHAGSLGSGVS